ncbi:MAG TPA: CvpA family protein [Verrucomicrobiae bacterium]|nr:CvpA family protein [Verrucomicrobiae bacterium]
MNLDALTAVSVSWVDFVILVLLGVGLWRGRKRGMSEELLDILKWLVIVVAATYLYEPAGRGLSETTSVFSLLSCYVFAYFSVAVMTFIVFAYIRKSVGAKIVGSDAFGDSEYYLGMTAGVLRYACIILVAMAFLNARYYSPEEIAAANKYEQDNYGSDFFPSMPDIQRQVFYDSLVGRLTHQHLNMVLIRPTAPDGSGIGKDTNIGRKRERSVYEVLEKR